MNRDPGLTRREFVCRAAAWSSSIALSPALTGCSGKGGNLQTIRFGSPEVFGQSALRGGVIVGIANQKGWLEEEFGQDGIQLDFQTFKGGAPLVGQALANEQLDFAVQGDLMSVIGRSAGVKAKVILPSVKFGNAFLAVGRNSNIRSLQDLRGRKVSYFKGNYIHLQVLRILKSVGMAESDIKSIYLDNASAKSALIAGDVDAVFGAYDLLALRDQGVADIVYTTVDQSPHLTAQSGFLVTEKFANGYPEVTQRVVNVIVKTAKWMSQPENKEEVLQLWTSDNHLRRNVEEDLGPRPLINKLSPLMDEFFIGQYRLTQHDAGELGLLHGKSFNVEEWLDSSYLHKSLATLGLEGFWTALDANGAPVSK